MFIEPSQSEIESPVGAELRCAPKGARDICFTGSYKYLAPNGALNVPNR